MTLYRGARPIQLDELHRMIIACRAAQERAQAAVAHSPNGRTTAWLAIVTSDLDRLVDHLPRPRSPEAIAEALVSDRPQTMPSGRMG